MKQCPEIIKSDEELDIILSEPSDELVEMMKRLDGDIMILGIAGKMGLTLGRRALNAIKLAKVDKKVIGVSRFSDKANKELLDSWGIETISCDLIEREEIAKLPQVKNIIFMAGKKFGTIGGEPQTWAMNTIVPYNVVEHFGDSRIVVFSTGCVYPLISSNDGGCSEQVEANPIGEYAQSCLGRERIFEFGAKKKKTKLLLFRLNYAIDLRYGVLHDIAQQINNGEKVNNSVGHFNVIWQGDANDIALRALEHTTYPANILNVTGPDISNIEYIAQKLATNLEKNVEFATQSADRCYLSDAKKMIGLFGNPTISVDKLIEWQASWIKQGGMSLGKPTHFEVNNGKF